MSDQKHRGHAHQELQNLFDQSAQTPSPAQRERMARAAAQIPTQTRPSWLDAFRLRPAIALGMAAAAAAGAFWLNHSPATDLSNPTDIVADQGPNRSPSMTSSSPLEVATNTPLQNDDDEFWADSDPFKALARDDAADDPMFALDLLHGPSDNADISEWALAYEAVLQDG